MPKTNAQDVLRIINILKTKKPSLFFVDVNITDMPFEDALEKYSKKDEFAKSISDLEGLLNDWDSLYQSLTNCDYKVVFINVKCARPYALFTSENA